MKGADISSRNPGAPLTRTIYCFSLSHLQLLPQFHSANELMSEIQIDLERLYLNNVPPAYFQNSPGRLEALANNLFLICTQMDKEVGYRQGMHEVRSAREASGSE